jgi:hypothetical protein
MVYAASGMATRIENVKCSILGLNGELAAVHERFRLPFAVELGIDQPAPVKRKQRKRRT